MKPPELRLSTNRSSEVMLAAHRAPPIAPLTGDPYRDPGVEGSDQEARDDARQEKAKDR